MVEGLDFDLSYDPTIDSPHILFMIAISTAEAMTYFFVDISNEFQTNIVEDPKKIHNISLPALYIQWFKAR